VADTSPVKPKKRLSSECAVSMLSHPVCDDAADAAAADEKCAARRRRRS